VLKTAVTKSTHGSETLNHSSFTIWTHVQEFKSSVGSSRMPHILLRFAGGGFAGGDGLGGVLGVLGVWISSMRS
jgi:hypothetical protein